MILVGLAVVAGTNIYNEYSMSSNRDLMVTNIQSISANSNQFYNTPKGSGGGGKSYTNWELPSSFAKTASGTITATVRANRINLNARGYETGWDKKSKVRVTAIIYPNRTAITIRN